MKQHVIAARQKETYKKPSRHEVMFWALCSAHNALMDYVDRLERQGCGMYYGRSVIREVEAAIALGEPAARREKEGR